MITVTCDTLASTNSTAKALAEEHPGRSIVVIAGEQTAGRGRRGRTWTSPRGGVWMSIARPTDPTRPTHHLPLLTGLAVREAVLKACAHPGDDRAALARRLAIKWPNDLLIDGRKVAGVLCERIRTAPINPGGPDDHAAIVGIGVNADFGLDLLPPDTRLPATTLRHAMQRPIDAPALTGEIASAFERHADDDDRAGNETLTPEALHEINANLAFRNEPVRFTVNSREHNGVLLNVDPHGHAIVRTDAGVVSINAGDIEHLSPHTPETEPKRLHPSGDTR